MQAYLKPGSGYWDITVLGIGGHFRRVGENRMPVHDIEVIPKWRGVDRKAITDDGRKVAFQSYLLEEVADEH
jgi:hypothetical protein